MCDASFVVASTVPSDSKSHAYVTAVPSGSAPLPVKSTASGVGPDVTLGTIDAVGAASCETPLPPNVSSSRLNRFVVAPPGCATNTR